MHKKLVMTVGMLICFAMSACEKAETPAPSETPAESTPEPPAAKQEAPAPPPVASTAPATPPPVPPAATPAPTLAPEGVFYLIQKVSVETDAGIVGLNPGTKAVKQPDGRFQADGHTVDLEPGQITNNLAIAQQAVSADLSAQQRLRQVMATRAAAAPPVSSSAAPDSVPQEVAATSQPAPTAAQRDHRFSREYVDPTVGKSGGLQSSANLNAKHTRTGEGFLWQKSPDGQWWVPVKRLSGRDDGYRPPNKPVR